MKNIFISLALCSIIFLPFFAIQAAAYEPVAPNPAEIEGVDVSAATGLGDRSPIDTTSLIINWLLTILGLIFLCLTIYGGIIWMLSRGNEEEVTKARNILKAAVIGLIIVLVSYGITAFIFMVLVGISSN